MRRGWWKGAVALLVTMGMLGHDVGSARADGPIIEVGVGVTDSTPCLVGDELYDPVGDVCNVLDRWETEAIASVKVTRGITGGSDDDVRAFATADVRFELLARMLRTIQKTATDRTADEAVVYTWLQNAQRKKGIKIAERALVEFEKYDGPAGTTTAGPGWCSYTPPAPYQNDRPSWSVCSPTFNPLTAVFSLPPTYPDAQTWAKWGTAAVLADGFTLDGFNESTALSSAGVAGISGTLVGAAAGGTIAALTLAVGKPFIDVLAPFAAATGYKMVSAAVALSIATTQFLATAAFVVFAVAVALAGIIYAAILTFARDDIRNQLNDGIANANAPILPNLNAVAFDSVGVAQLFDLISSYLVADTRTPALRPAPARTSSDMLFERRGQRTTTTTIQKWDGTSGTLEMRGGYLVIDGVAATGAEVLDRNGDQVSMFRAKLSSGAWGWIIVPAETTSSSCITTTPVSCPVTIDAEILDGTGAYVTLRAVADPAPALSITAEAQTSGGSTYDLAATATWNGQNLADTTTWWRPDPTTQSLGLFTSTVSVCSPWVDPFGTTIPAATGTRFFDGVCYRTFATGATATYSVVSNAAVKLQALVVSPSGQTSTASVDLAGNTAVQTLTLTQPTPIVIDEGQLWVLTGQVVEAAGTSQPISVALDWNDGTGVQNSTIPAAGLLAFGAIGFSSSRSGTTATFQFNKNLNDEAFGTVGVTTTGSATASASTAYRARNVAPTVNSITIDGCDGTPSCLLTPGQTATVRGQVTDPGVLDDVNVMVSVSGGTPVPATVTAGRLIRVTSIGSAQTPMPWDYVAQVTLPTTGTASTTVTVTATDDDFGTTTRTKDYAQLLPYVTPSSVTATAAGPEAIDVAYISNLGIGTTLAVTWNAECRSTDGSSIKTGTGGSPIRVSGLVAGTTYSCKVFSRSTLADSPSVTAADVTLPSGLPVAPTGVVATPGTAGKLNVAFTPVPAPGIIDTPLCSTCVNLGGTLPPPAPLSVSYAVTCTSATGATGTGTGSASPITVSGLTGGAIYTCVATASTSYGAGPDSAPSAPVEVLGVPSAPTGVVVAPTETLGTVTVSFTAPTDLGGATSVSYEAVCSGQGLAPRSATGTTSPISVSGVNSNPRYSCVVSAITSAGTTASAPAPIPVAYAAPATNVVAVAKGSGSVEVLFTPSTTTLLPVSYQLMCITDGVDEPIETTGTASPISLSGLTVGATYRCRVLASTSWGFDFAAVLANVSISNDVVVLGVPGAPTDVVVSPTATSGTASVSFTPPTAMGGATSLTYEVSCTSPTGPTRTATGTSSPITVTGLAPTASYSCVVTAVNGAGQTSSGSADLPSPVPAAPTGVGATLVASGRLSVGFTPVSSAVPVTYSVSCTSATGATGSATGSASPIEVSGLTVGASYRCAVTASAVWGAGPPSSPSSAVTVLGVPGAPTAVVATPTTAGVASVSFQVPTNTGGSSNYEAVCSSATGTTVTATGTASPITVSGLTAAASYTCVVAAVNSLGRTASAPSAAFGAVGVPGAPGRPTLFSPVDRDRSYVGRVDVAFTAPSSNGGSAITSYRATCSSADGSVVRSATGTRSPISVTGFSAPLTVVSCTVAALNRVGAGPESATSLPISVFNVATAPAAPSVVRLGPGRVAVTVTGATSSTQFPILEYRTVCRSLNGRDVEDEESRTNRIVVSGLRLRLAYTCTAQVRTALGWSAASAASASFTA